MGERRKEERMRDGKSGVEGEGEREKARNLGVGEKMTEIIIPKFCFSQGPT